MNPYYAIYAEDGTEICTGIQTEVQARRYAQDIANTTGRTVYLAAVPPEGDEEAIEPATTRKREE